MKKLGASALVFAIFVLMIGITASAEQYPKPTGFVNDFAGVLTTDQGVSLNAELIAFEKKTTIEISVVTVPWLNNQSVEDYTRGLAQEWGVGKKGKNNGVVFLIAPKERKMRIEVASGISSTLPSSRTDQIRDEDVIPQFKARNMSQGIIDGTHAIMRVLDPAPSPAPVASDSNTVPATAQPSVAEQPSTDQSTSTWTAEDTQIMWYVLAAAAVIVVLLIIWVPGIRRSNARKYVLENKGALINRFADAEKTAKKSGVKNETRGKLTKLKSKLSSLEYLTVESNANWIEMREAMDSVDYPLTQIISTMESEIEFAEKAEREGPKLMQELPGLLDAAEAKLAEGKESPKARRKLDEARTLYAQAQQQQSGMSTTDWVILYMLLNDSHQNALSAQSTHEYANAPATDSSWGSTSSSSSSSDSPSSFGGFGDSGGFGGGDSGSSGSW